QPYVADDYTNNIISPKLKLSNRERNVINRQKYDSTIIAENRIEADILYKDFSLKLSPKSPTRKTNKNNTDKSSSEKSNSETDKKPKVKRTRKPKTQEKEIKN